MIPPGIGAAASFSAVSNQLIASISAHCEAKKKQPGEGLLMMRREKSSRRQEAPPQGSGFHAACDQVQVMRPFAEDEQVLAVSE
jgi:hypothetical protein